MPVIRVHSHTFTISDPFQSGRPLTQADLAALDRYRAENIRYQVAKWMEKAGWPIPPQEIKTFESKVAKLDETYEFESPKERRQSTSLYDKILQEVAQEEALKVLHSQGRIHPSEQDIQDISIQLTDQSDVQTEAKRRLDIQVQVAQGALKDLI